MEYRIRDYGAKGDGMKDDAPYIQAAIDECTKNGGGRVVCEAGTYLCSTIFLKSNVDLYLEMGCTIISSLDASSYSGEKEALIEAKDAENIAISGYGTIDGRSYLVYYDDNQDPLHEAPLDYPVGAFRPRTTKFENIRNLSIKDITIKNSVFWTLHFAGCNYITVSGVKIFNDIRCNNNDGIDPDCCKNVVISDCIIVAGDDPVVIKTTKPMAEKYGSCENIVVNNCIMRTKSAGLKIGTETWGDIRNIQMSNCVIEECGRMLSITVRDGGTIENIRVSNVRAACRAYSACKDNKHIGAGYPYWWGKGESIYISNMPRDYETMNPGTIRNITLTDLDIDSESSLFIVGSEYGKIEDIEVRNCKLQLKRIGTQEPGWFDFRPSPMEVVKHDIPGIYVKCVENIRLKNVSVKFVDQAEAWSEVIWMEDAKGILLDELKGKPAKDNLPAARAIHVSELEFRKTKIADSVERV